MVIARWFAGRIGERAPGNVVLVKPFGLVVQLTGTGATGTIAMDALPDGPYHVEASGYAVSSEKRRYEVGEPILVRVAGANEELGRVDLEVVTEGSQGRSPGPEASA
jgi:ribonuclease R